MPSTGNPSPSDTDQALHRINSLRLAEHSMDTLLQAVVDETKTILPRDVEASISVLLGARPATAVYSGQPALDLDETQYERGHGPCLLAATSGELVVIVDARTDDRWPDYTRRAVEQGRLSSLSVPLPMAELDAGLNIYATETGNFDEATRTAALRFAGSAAAAISNMHAYQTANDLASNLQVALRSRASIDQAKGVLMERHKLTADQAFQLLAATSQGANVKLREVAERLIHTGELVSPPARRRPTAPSNPETR